MIELDSENFEREVLNSIRPCIVKFHNKGCHLCAGLHPVFAGLEKKYGLQMKFASMDTGSHGELAESYLDGGVPTVRIFLKGRPPLLVQYPEEPSVISGYTGDYLERWIHNVLAAYAYVEEMEKEKNG